MAPEFYRKKPLPIQAIRYEQRNAKQVKEFVGEADNGDGVGFLLPEEIAGISKYAKVWNSKEHQWLNVPVGHWVIRGIEDEFYPCDPRVFQNSYEWVPTTDPDISGSKG